MGEGGIYFDGGRGLKKNMKCAHPSIHPLEETLFMTYGYYFNDFLQILNGPKHKTACCLLSNYISLPWVLKNKVNFIETIIAEYNIFILFKRQ